MTKGFLNDDFDVPGDITAGGIESTPIGGTTPAAVAGTTGTFDTISLNTTASTKITSTRSDSGNHIDFVRGATTIGSLAANTDSIYALGGTALDAFRILPAATGYAFICDQNGIITMGEQPLFIASKAAAQTNVTGNNTAVTVTFGTEIKDQGGDYVSPTFTSPVTGSYPLCTHFDLEQIGGMTTGLVRIRTSNRQWGKRLGTDQDSAARKGVELDCVADMDAADTAFVEVVITGVGADTSDIAIDGATVKYGFAGYLQA
jgi:hypothetical protein